MLLIPILALHGGTLLLALLKALGRLRWNSWWVVPTPTFLSWGIMGALHESPLGYLVLLASLFFTAWAWMKPARLRFD
jgi:hypothetical protein